MVGLDKRETINSWKDCIIYAIDIKVFEDVAIMNCARWIRRDNGIWSNSFVFIFLQDWYYKSEICILGTIDSIQRENWLNFFYLTKVAAAATTLALEMSNISKIFATKRLLRHDFNAQDLVLIFTKALDGLVHMEKGLSNVKGHPNICCLEEKRMHSMTKLSCSWLRHCPKEVR